MTEQCICGAHTVAVDLGRTKWGPAHARGYGLILEQPGSNSCQLLKESGRSQWTTVAAG